MKTLKTMLGAAALLAAVATMPSCSSSGTKKTEAAGAADSLKKVLVKVVTTQLETIDVQAEFTGNIEGNVVNNIGPNMPVRIDKILVDVGSPVSKGQLLVRMDPTNYNQAAVQLSNLETDFARLKSVYDAGGVSRQQLDQLETQVRVSREQVQNLRENIELRSPTAGVVTDRRFDAGDLYPGQGGILTVMQINPLKVSMDVSEFFFPQVKKGMEVDVVTDLFQGEVFKGKVSLISPAINPATRTFTVEVTIPNNNQRLRPGMYCRTTIRLGEKQGVMLSDLAVQKQIGTAERYVFVVRDGVAHRQTVTLGRQVSNRYDILTGLTGGEQVVVSGASRLLDGTPVDVMKE